MRIVDVKFKDIKDTFDKMGQGGPNNTGGDDGGGGYKRPAPNYKKSFKTMFLAFMLVVIVFGASTCFYSVDQTEYVILTMFGVPDSNIQSPGLKFKLPFGIQEIIRVPKKTFSTTLGYTQEGDQVRVSDKEKKESKMITGDENIILADIEVQWRVTDPIAFVYNYDKPEVIIYNAVSSSLRNVIGSSTVDEALTDGRSKIIEKVKEKLVEIVSDYNIGISIINVNLQDVDLPTKEVDAAFKSVTDAREEKNTKINEASKYKNEKLNELVGKEAALLSSANAQKTVAVQKAIGDVANFNAIYSEYVKAPEITRKDLTLRTLNEIYKGAKIMITDGGNTIKHMSIEDMMKGAQ